MDMTGLTKGELAVHATLTEELGDAIASSNVDAVKRLHSSWVELHQSRRSEIRRLKQAIQREEAHFRFSEADKLRAELDALQ